MEFKKLLTSKGYSITSSRFELFKLLLGKEPLTMAEITSIASTFANRATVYRNIELFEKLGIVNRLQIGWKYKLELSDRFHPHHHHISCISCGKIEQLTPDNALEKYFMTQASKLGYKLSDHQLELSGTCMTCTKT